MVGSGCATPPRRARNGAFLPPAASAGRSGRERLPPQPRSPAPSAGRLPPVFWRFQMSTRFAGRLFGSLADDVSQPLADARVRVYRLQGDVPPCDPAEPLPAEAVARKETRLVAEADLDRQGGFALELEEPQEMELDVRVA